MIEIKNLSFSYTKEKYIDNLSLTLNDGELTVLIGANGSGKSTLVRLAVGELCPADGEIFVDGESLRELDRYEAAKRLAYFPEGRPVPHLTVYEMVSLGRFPYTRGSFTTSKEDAAAVEEALSLTELSPLRDRRLDSLSYGQRQRAFLAMLLAQGAKNAIFDEPANFLDEGARFRMLDMIKRLSRTGAVMAVLHDLSLALTYADRIILMSEGGAVFDGTPARLYQSGIVEKTLGVRLIKIETEGGRAMYVTAEKTDFNNI